MGTKITAVLLTVATMSLVLLSLAADAQAQPRTGFDDAWDRTDTGSGAALMDPFVAHRSIDWDPLEVAIDAELMDPFRRCAETPDLADPYEGAAACGLIDPWARPTR